MVSVIIPAYNYAKFLPDALNSLLSQSFKDWECIIINNGSHDNTEEVAKSYLQKDSRFKYFSIENKGVSHSRNFALKQANGDFIQFLDADDLIESEKFSKQIDFLNQHREVDLVYGDAKYFTTENMNLRKFSMHDDDKSWMPLISGKDKQLSDALLKRNIFPINAPLLRKSLIEKFGGFDESLTGLEDWDLWLRLAVNGCYFKYLDEINTTALIRIHATSASQDKKMMHAHILPVLQHYLLHPYTNLKQKLYLLIRYEEELLDTFFYMARGRLEKIIPSPSDSALSFILLLCGSMLFLPFYLLLKTYRKLF